MGETFYKTRVDGAIEVWELRLVTIIPAGGASPLPSVSPIASASLAPGEIVTGVKGDDPRLMLVTFPRKSWTEDRARDQASKWLGDRDWQMVKTPQEGLATAEHLRQFFYVKIAPPSAFREGTHRYLNAANGAVLIVADPRSRAFRDIPSAASIPGALTKV